MKKLLLLIAGLLVCTSVSAGDWPIDPNKYDEIDGIKIQNVFIHDRFHDRAAFEADQDLCLNNYARTAVLKDGIVYIAHSTTEYIVVAPGDTVNSVGRILRYNAETGEKMTPLEVTLNGRPYGGLLCVNQIGIDNFGHFWIMPYTSESAAAKIVPFYQLDEKTGALTLFAELDKGPNFARVDYCDIVGDITLEEAQCNILAPGSSSEMVYGWHNDQGGDASTWTGFFNDGAESLKFLQFYPDNAAGWSYAPSCTFVLGTDPEDLDGLYRGDLFYIDGFNLRPALYDFEGNLVDHFGNAADDVAADKLLDQGDPGANGIREFTLNDHHFIAYPEGQYDNGHTCQINVTELGEGDAFAGMKRWWSLPADGLGNVSDQGTRIHCINYENITAGGEDAILLLDYKCFNGLAVYKIGRGVNPTGSDYAVGDVNKDGSVNTGDVSATYDVIVNGKDNPAADVNGDGSINTGDVSAIYAIILNGN